MRTINGMRVPESYSQRLARGKPTPWSLQKKTIVLSASPDASSARRCSPTHASIAVINS